MKAHQRVIREQKSAEEPDNLFGRYWEGIDLTLKNAVVKETNYETAKRIIEEYEWLGQLPAISMYYYGIFFEGNCAGVVVYSPEYSENLGTWDKYGFTGKIILLARGACTHWSPPNSASKLIRTSMRLLPSQYEVVTATVDSKAGEIGTIYQACGFYYVGAMNQSNINFGIEVNGKLIGRRTIRHQLGTQSMEQVRKAYPDAKEINQVAKGRYFAFRSSAETIQKHMSAIQHLIKPYPKRENE